LGHQRIGLTCNNNCIIIPSSQGMLMIDRPTVPDRLITEKKIAQESK
jgi:hypothetical protein